MSGIDDGFDADDEDESPLQSAVAGAVTAVTLLVAFGLLALEVSFFWVAFVVGFGGVLPTAVALTKYYEQQTDGPTGGAADGATGGETAGQTTAGRAPSGDSASETEDALEALRARYARGELSEAEFEQRVERLLETESVEDARKYVASDDASDERTSGASGSERGRNRERDAELERERDLERE